MLLQSALDLHAGNNWRATNARARMARVTVRTLV